MGLMIDLSPDVETRLQQEATRRGIDKAEYARQLIESSLPAPRNALSALLRSWREEDATDDPEEIKAAEEELAEFKRAMNANRAATGERLLFP